MDKVNKLYEVIIGEYKTETVPGAQNPDGTTNPDTTKTTYNDRVAVKNIVAEDVADAIAKAGVGQDQHVEAVNKLNIVDAV